MEISPQNIFLHGAEGHMSIKKNANRVNNTDVTHGTYNLYAPLGFFQL
jgi:hypothetical protein